ncbi:MAG: C40 family peptidase [Ignavibacteriae bacterium]|nr:C40 family peptidase [Ignavibacteriota bacterium]
MNRIILHMIIFFFAFSLYAQQDSYVNFYLNDGNVKQYKISDIENIGFIKGLSNYEMNIFYQDSLNSEYSFEVIDSIKFTTDTNNLTSLLVYSFNSYRIYAVVDIDSINYSIIDSSNHDKLTPEALIIADSLYIDDFSIEEALLPTGEKVIDYLLEHDSLFLKNHGYILKYEPPEEQVKLLISRMTFIGLDLKDEVKYRKENEGENKPAQNKLAYLWGGADERRRLAPSSGSKCQYELYGLDCSGLIYRVANESKLIIGRMTAEKYKSVIAWNNALKNSKDFKDVKAIKFKENETSYLPGDLILFIDYGGIARHIGFMCSNKKGILINSLGDPTNTCQENMSDKHGPVAMNFGKLGYLTYEIIRFTPIQQSVPHISNVIPNRPVTIGEQITISGTNFGSRGSNYVSFNSLQPQVNDYISWNDIEIKVKVPQCATSGKLSVTIAGQKSNELDFSVIGPDFTNQNPVDATTCSGTSINFTSNPVNANEYQWQENGTDLVDGGIYSGVKTTILLISNVTGLNSKQYKLKAKNNGCPVSWVISNAATLTVTSSPDFTNQHPQNVTACSGSSCYFRSIPANADEYQWQILNGINWNDLNNIGVYTGVKTNTLLISNVTGLNGNQYRLKAKNKGCPTDWVISSAATLTVPLEPTFTTGQHPINTTACNGSSCNFVSNPANSNEYQWMENGVDLTNSGVYSGVKTTTLMISNVTGLNDRQYILKAKNMGCPVSSWVLSNPVTLTVPIEPDFTGHHPTNQTANSGSSSNFTSNPTNANSYLWQILNGSNWTDLSNTGVYSGVTTTTLVISNVTGLDGKQYRLKAKNNSCPVAWVISNPATLTVTSSNPDEVTIGTQIWKTKNLNVSTYRNGDPIPQVTDPTEWGNLTTGAWCYYNNDPANGTVYGKLYNWYAVNDPRGLAPIGWHIPSDGEWTTLTNQLGGESIAGGKLKEIGTTHWSSPNTGATNESGFTGLPSGYRSDSPGNGTFYSINNGAMWWSTTTIGDSSWWRVLFYNETYVTRAFAWNCIGASVRCVKD